MIMELSLEHIHPDLIDIEVEVEYDEYHGSTDHGSGHLNSEDPSEIDIKNVTVLQQIEYIENGKKYTLYKGDVLLLDDVMKEQIYEKCSR